MTDIELTEAQGATLGELTALPEEALMMYAEQVGMPESSQCSHEERAEWLVRNKPDLSARLAERGVPEIEDTPERVTGWNDDPGRLISPTEPSTPEGQQDAAPSTEAAPRSQTSKSQTANEPRATPGT